MKFHRLAASIALSLVVTSPLQVHAYGNEDNVTSTTSGTPKKCKKGKTWNKKKKRCVKKSSDLGQQNLLTAKIEGLFRV